MTREGDILVSPEPWEESKVLQVLPGFGFCHAETSIYYMGETKTERNKVNTKDRGLKIREDSAMGDIVVLEFLGNET